MTTRLVRECPVRSSPLCGFIYKASSIKGWSEGWICSGGVQQPPFPLVLLTPPLAHNSPADNAVNTLA